ncbi:MAG TPA: hypothetical protein VEY51_05840 [Chondromyces sp.]|nr:hypothetical protein [Chondromyces sp.]
MLFSYYFDTKKTHLLNCHFKILQFIEKANGIIEIMFSAEIAEWQNGAVKKKETKVATFTFPPAQQGQTKHDIDFIRLRYGDQKKWIFTVINNKNSNQKVEVGLISDTANKNPLGLDVYHDDEGFEMELKANTLSILEPTYQPPILTQTLVNTKFEQAGYPERFGSYTAIYDSTYQNYRLSDFIQYFSEPIPPEAAFKIQMDIAPTEVQTVSGIEIFRVIVPQLGRVSLLKNGFEFQIHNGLTSDIVRALLNKEVAPMDFWNHGMTSKAKLSIEGDGKGKLFIRYYDTTLEATYDPTCSFVELEFRGVQAKDGDANDPNNWVFSRVDNISVIYQK